RLEWLHAEDRAERFLRHELGVVGWIGHDGRLEEIPLLPDGMAAGDDLRAARVRILDETRDGRYAALVRERAHARVGFEAGADLELLHLLEEARHEAVVRLLLHVEARGRDADLAGIPEFRGSHR